MNYGPVQSNTVEEAWRRLREYGANIGIVEAAIRTNPQGPVTTLSLINRDEVVYDVVIGVMDDGDIYPSLARYIWQKRVAFGNKRNNVAGGTDFTNAAREQERVAWAALKLIEGDNVPTADPIVPDPDATAPIIRGHLMTGGRDYETRQRSDGAYDVRELPDGAWQFCPTDYFHGEFCVVPECADNQRAPVKRTPIHVPLDAEDVAIVTRAKQRELRELVKRDPIGFPVPIARSIPQTLRAQVDAAIAGPYDATLEDPDAPPEPGAVKKQGTWVDEHGFIVEPGHPQQGCKLENSEGYIEEQPEHVTPEVLHEILLLVVECPPRLDAIRAWTPAQLDEVEAWAVATHVAANDHIDITPPPYPSALGPTKNGVPDLCGNCGKGGHISGTCPNPVVYR